MGSSSSSNADVATLKSQMTTLQSKLSNYDAVSTAALKPSTNVTVDYDALGTKLVTTSDNLTKIRDSLINSGTKLSDAVVPAMANNEAIKTAIRSSITANNDFANSVAGILTSNDTYKAKLKGDTGTPGSIGDYTAVKSNLHSSTLSGAKHGATVWCGDGDFCVIPKDTKGFDWGYGSSKIYDDGQLRVVSDDNITLKVGDKSQKGVHITQAGVGGVVIGDEERGDFTGLNIKHRDGRWTHFDWKDDQKNYIRGETHIDGLVHVDRIHTNWLQSKGFAGPFLIRAYDKGDKCWDVGQNNGLGLMNCDANNSWQRFWFSPVTGQIYNEQNKQCFNKGDTFHWEGCNNHQDQQFWKKEHIIQWKNWDCIDIGNDRHHAGCNGDNENQKVRFEYVG